MAKSEVKIGILGFGIVGSGTYQVLTSNADDIEQRIGAKLTVAKIGDIDWERQRDVMPPPEIRTTDAYSIINDPDIDIIVETIGGTKPATEFVLAAIEAGKCVVTSNKEMMARDGEEILARAAAKGVDVQFEGAVGGVIPIIRSVKESLIASHLEKVVGIVNGTTNYILTRMSLEGKQYQEILQDAQALGYAEANPTADVEGIDAANKIAILAAIAFGLRVDVDEVYREGITGVTAEDIHYAEKMGYVIKLLAIAKRGEGTELELRVHPAFVPKAHPLAGVNGVFNAIFVHGDACDDVMLYGRGAGSLPTGSAVVGDVIDCARNVLRGAAGRVPCACTGDATVKPIEDVETSVYIRMRVTDRPGVMGTIATIFGQEGVSIQSVIQEASFSGGIAEIVWVVHKGPEKHLRRALASVEHLGIVESIPSVIRVEE